MSNIIPRATIEAIVGHRNAAIGLFSEAISKFDEAFEAVRTASAGSMFYIDDKLAKQAFSSYDKDHEEFLAGMRRQADVMIWNHLINAYGFERLMDRQAKEEFQSQLQKDPPEVSVEIAHATLANLICSADMIFRRGIANAFSKLDRRFRTHDGFKIGTKIILNYAFNENGRWSHHSQHDATIRDIERIFLTLDQVEFPERYAGIVGCIDQELNTGPYEARAFSVENDYFRAQVFKKGTLHLWFKRPDLVRRVNQLLAEHYGEVLGAGADACEDDPLSRPSTSLAKTLGWFPTPPAAAKKLVSEANIDVSTYLTDRTPIHYRILEPSAGEGAIARQIAETMKTSGATYDLDMVEIHPDRVEALGALRLGLVIENDFLQVIPRPEYDRVIMNPPFDHFQDIDHVVHALKFLAPGGRLVAIMSAGIEFRSDKKTVAFRDLIERMKGKIQDLPVGSFAESGTNVNTVIVTLSVPA